MTRLALMLLSGVLFLPGCGGGASSGAPPPAAGSIVMKFDAPLIVGGKARIPHARLTTFKPDGTRHDIVVPGLFAERHPRGVIIAGESRDGHAYVRLDEMGLVIEWSVGPQITPTANEGQ